MNPDLSPGQVVWDSSFYFSGWVVVLADQSGEMDPDEIAVWQNDRRVLVLRANLLSSPVRFVG